MSTINWPTSLNVVASLDLSIEYDVQIDISRSGRIDTYGLPGARLVAVVTFAADLETRYRPQVEALVASLRGGARALSMHHLGRPVPNGTITGSPTVATATAAGDNTMALGNCNGTFKAGDWFGIGDQMVMVEEDVAPVSSAMTAKISPAVRAVYPVGTVITLVRPSILWVPKSSVAGPFPYRPAKVRPGFSIELVERG
jgi:hypothetical protein